MKGLVRCRGAASPRVGLEPIEHLVHRFRRNAGTAVGDRKHHGVGPALGGKRNGLARRRETDRVGQQIEQDLAQPPPVGVEAADAGRGADIEREPSFLSRSCTPSAASSMQARISTS